ncbi:hypothetical protein COOONC_06539 [Cooperia oncophora]
MQLSSHDYYDTANVEQLRRLTNDSEEIEIAAKDLEVLEELGKGGYGVVEKMRHRHSGIVMAVKVRNCNHLLRIR